MREDERDVEALAERLRRAFWDPDNGGQWGRIAAAVLASDWYAVRIARAEQHGREDNDDHGMCYVSGSEALAAREAEVLRDAANAGPSSTATDQLWRMWLRNRAAAIQGDA